jgi:hypothetical protein
VLSRKFRAAPAPSAAEELREGLDEPADERALLLAGGDALVLLDELPLRRGELPRGSS